MANESINVAERIDTPSGDFIDHNSLELVNGQRLVGSDLSTFINSLGGLASIFSPANILALLSLFIKPQPAPTPSPVPVPTPVPNPVLPSFNLTTLLQGIIQLLLQMAQPLPAPINPGPVNPQPVNPVNPSPIKVGAAPAALPVEKRPSKDEVISKLKAEGVQVEMIPPGLLVVIIQLAIQFGLPFIQGLIAKFKK